MSRETAMDYIREQLDQSSDRVVALVYWFIYGLTREKT